MRFFIDEQSAPALEIFLSKTFGRHLFRTFQQEGLAGTADIPLFDELASRAFDAIITDDRQQLKGDRTERDKLRSASLHWIGYKRAAIGGPAGLAIAAGGLLSAFPTVLDTLAEATAPVAIRVKGSERLRTQLITVETI